VKLLDGGYPDWRQVLPKTSPPCRIAFTTENLAEYIKLIGSVPLKQEPNHPVLLASDGKLLSIRYHTDGKPAVGSVQLPAALVYGQPYEVVVNWGFLIDALRAEFTEVGISGADLLRISLGDAYGQSNKAVDAVLDHSHALEDIMTPDPVHIEHDASIRDAVDILIKADFHALPVVEGKKLVGILTTHDLLRFLRGLY